MCMLSNRDLSFPVIPLIRLIRPGGADAGEDVRPGKVSQAQGRPFKGTRYAGSPSLTSRIGAGIRSRTKQDKQAHGNGKAYGAQ